MEITKQKALSGLAVFSAGYLKRWLESNFYDKIFATELGEKLKGLNKTAKYGIEAGLNLLNVFFDNKLRDDTPLKRVIKEIGLDTASEVSKRLINNTKSQLVNAAYSVEEKELVNVLLSLDDQVLVEVLKWLYETDTNERAKLLTQLSHLSFDETAKLAKLSAEDRKKFLELLKLSKPSQKSSEKVASNLKSFNEDWGKWLRKKKVGKK